MSTKLGRHIHRERDVWEKNQAKELAKLKAAQRHLIYNVAAYLLISIIEYWLAAISRSQTLRADAFNNLSGIISTVLLMIGLHIARDIDDNDIAGVELTNKKHHNMGGDQRIQFVRWRYETVFSLVTGVIMIVIACSVIINGIKALLTPGERVVPDAVALIGAAIASVIMLIVWFMNRRAGKKLQNAALLASAQDSLADAFTSIGTMVAIAGALFFKISWLDGATSIVVGFFILYSGIKIFFQTSLNLADYFDPLAESEYREAIHNVKKVRGVSELSAHYNGNVVSLDATVIVNGKMTVLQSYQLSEKIERMLRDRFGIIDADISFIPDPDSFSDKDVKGHF